MAKLVMVAAMDQANAIGIGDRLPWRKLSADMKHFQDSTTGKAVAMGRKTYESIPKKFRPLKDRLNMILTRDQSFQAPGCVIAHHEHMVMQMTQTQDVYIIGGAEIYRLFLPRTQELLITHVHALVPDTDTFFPTINATEWQKQFVMRHDADDKNEFCFSVVRYTRIRRGR
ncbi:MAG: dihydrofolate reductase [Candidatus Zambryskibacteria bacterium]|nr:dihydrofolate reductase [Candidatus Zambryskibacteria bacterium]